MPDDLNSWIKKLTQDIPALTKLTARKAEEKVKQAILDHWQAGQDPYGKEWAPLANGQPSYLYDTGDMQESLSTRVNNNGNLIYGIDSPANYHQSGTGRMPARKLFPDDDLPETYKQACMEAYEEAWNETMK